MTRLSFVAVAALIFSIPTAFAETAVVIDAGALDDYSIKMGECDCRPHQGLFDSTVIHQALVTTKNGSELTLFIPGIAYNNSTPNVSCINAGQYADEKLKKLVRALNGIQSDRIFLERSEETLVCLKQEIIAIVDDSGKASSWQVEPFVVPCPQ